MAITWQVTIGLFVYAVVLTAAVPLLVRRQTWYLRRPDRVLTIWFVALFSSLGALALAMVLALKTLANDRAHLHGTRQALVVELSVWFLLVLAGAVIALVGARAERLSANVRRARQDMHDLSSALAYRTEDRAGCRITYFAADIPIACSLAGRQPEIFVSSGLEGRLSSPALEAVLAHELAHLAHHHGARTYLAELAAASAPWIPASRELRRSTAVLIEFAADDHACCTTATRDLVDALALMPPSSSALAGVRACRLVRSSNHLGSST